VLSSLCGNGCAITTNKVILKKLHSFNLKVELQTTVIYKSDKPITGSQYLYDETLLDSPHLKLSSLTLIQEESF